MRAGLIHRDIKPGNLFAAHRGGHHDDQAAGLRPGQDLAGERAIQLRGGYVAGSPLYVAPEQVVHSQPPTAALTSTRWGWSPHFLLTGRPPSSAPVRWRS
jgi:serine/threonine-protein kinase